MHEAGRDTAEVLTFMFTDVEGSTRLWQEAPREMSAALVRHEELILRHVVRHGGRLVKSGSRGDSALAVFEDAPDGVNAAVGIQRAFLTEDWPGGLALAVRIGIHSGEAETRDDDYFGPTLNRAARLHAIAHGGQTIVSAMTAQLSVGQLDAGIELRDLGDHVLKDIRTPERVHQVTADGLRYDFPPLRSVRASPRGMPVEATSFVGREQELEQIELLLLEGRMVTLTGVGGSGKTRLAVRLAARNFSRHEHGVVFVDLAPVQDGAAVARTFVVSADIADATVEATLDDADDASAALVAHLCRALEHHRTLLVVDNCEHVIEEVGAIVRNLLARCPDVVVLATSREPLAITGEQLFRVPPLPAPAADDLEDLTSLNRSGAVRLFCDRARSVRPDFVLDPGNATAVAEICRKLEGLPLAIELAAAQIGALTAVRIASRLDSIDVLRSRTRDSIDRHRTLEAALEWSHGFLNDEERALFRRAAVFTGGFTLDAAEGICTGPPVGESDVVELLSSLIHRSLVVLDERNSEARYRLLEPVRQFAGRKLDLAGEAAAVRDSHRDWYVQAAGDEAFMLYTSEERLSELRCELDNFRSALGWSIETGDAEAAMRIANPLNGVLVWVNQGAESDRWLTKVLEIAGDDVSELTASTIGTLAANLDLMGDVRRGVSLQRRAAAMFEQLEQPGSLLWSLIYLGHGLHFCNDYPAEKEAYARAFEIAVELGNNIALSLIPFLQTWLTLSQGDIEASQTLIRAVHDVGPDGHPGVRLGIEVFEGLVTFLDGRHEEGSRRCDQPIAELLTDFVDAAGNEDPMGLWCMNLAGTIEVTTPATRARGRDRLADLLPRARRTGLLGAFPNPLDSAAALAAHEHREIEAAHLYGAVSRLRQVSGVEMRYAVAQPLVDAGVELARHELGETRFEAEFQRGTALPLSEAIDVATAVLADAT